MISDIITESGKCSMAGKVKPAGQLKTARPRPFCSQGGGLAIEYGDWSKGPGIIAFEELCNRHDHDSLLIHERCSLSSVGKTQYISYTFKYQIQKKGVVLHLEKLCEQNVRPLSNTDPIMWLRAIAG